MLQYFGANWCNWLNLALSPHVGVHDVFHVSLLKKYVHDPNHVLYFNNIELKRTREF
jgi:hypothetical protein